MATKIPHTIYIKAGVEFREEFTWKQENGVPYDFSGCGARMQIRQENTGILLLELTTNNGMIILGSGEPNVTMLIDDSDSLGLQPGKALWDLLIDTPDDRVIAFPLEGRAILTKGPTL